MASEVTYTLNKQSVLEVIEAEAPDLSETARDRAAEDVLSAAEEICLFSLAEHVFEQTSIDLSSYEDEE